jgi:hypothetical protein
MVSEEWRAIRTHLLREESNMKIKTNIRAGLVRIGGGRRTLPVTTVKLA